MYAYEIVASSAYMSASLSLCDDIMELHRDADVDAEEDEIAAIMADTFIQKKSMKQCPNSANF